MSESLDWGDNMTDDLSVNFSNDSNYTDDDYPRRLRRPVVPISVVVTAYALIFILSMIGNILVVITLVIHKRMQTVTNILLLNLAVSDLMMGMICMPTTVTSYILKQYIFGEFVCTLQRYVEAVCTAASVYTLTVISLERFFAIVLPFWSRRWQTKSHAYKMILTIWCLGLVVMCPVPLTVRLEWLAIRKVYKCTEVWDDIVLYKLYTVVLLLLVLLGPLLVMMTSYSMIAARLYSKSREQGYTRSDAINMRTINGCSEHRELRKNDGIRDARDNNNLRNNRKVVKMLIVLVIEFFVCWSPVCITNTWAAFDPISALHYISPGWRVLITLMSYVTTCCNPITYCFMSDRFRRCFISLCCRRATRSSGRTYRRSPTSFQYTSTVGRLTDTTMSYRQNIHKPNEETIY